MTSIFIGGAFGSAIASSVYEHGGWLGVMLVGSAFPLIALLRFLSASRQATVATGLSNRLKAVFFARTPGRTAISADSATARKRLAG